MKIGGLFQRIQKAISKESVTVHNLVVQLGSYSSLLLTRAGVAVYK